jgi:hypothetical protein
VTGGGAGADHGGGFDRLVAGVRGGQAAHDPQHAVALPGGPAVQAGEPVELAGQVGGERRVGRLVIAQPDLAHVAGRVAQPQLGMLRLKWQVSSQTPGGTVAIPSFGRSAHRSCPRCAAPSVAFSAPVRGFHGPEIRGARTHSGRRRPEIEPRSAYVLVSGGDSGRRSVL